MYSVSWLDGRITTVITQSPRSLLNLLEDNKIWFYVGDPMDGQQIRIGNYLYLVDSVDKLYEYNKEC